MSALLILTAVALAVLAIDQFYRKVYITLIYWKKRNAPSLFSLPGVGSYWKAFFQLEHIYDLTQSVYKANSDKRLVGGFSFGFPVLFVRDPELVHEITVKHFDHFIDHSTTFFNESLDPSFTKSIMLLKGQDWHKVRGILSPAFTGSKMRGMFTLMVKCGEQLSQHLLDEIKESRNMVEIELKSKFTKFTNDIIATTAFGIEINSLKNPENQFYKNAQEATTFTLGRMFLAMFAPWIMKLLNESIVPRKTSKYFASVIKTTIVQREKLGIKRPDLLNLMIEAKQMLAEKKKTDDSIRELTDEDIASNSFIFFFAGYEMTSTTICFACYELALNQGVQKKLHEEIDNAVQDSAKSVTYETINDLKYLEAVITETLRKWTGGGGGFIDRECVKDYLVKDAFGDGKDFLIKKGDVIQVQAGAIHRDPKYYPEPDRFNPDRYFDEDGKFKVDQSIYLPFGSGPRHCIGIRFAMLEVKTAIYSILKDYEILPTEKTSNPIRLDKTAAFMVPENGFSVGLKLRNSTTTNL